MSRQHPVFVYGTLRPGQGNYQRLLVGRSVRESPAIVIGLALYGTGFPYAVPQPGARVVGELITINPDQYVEVLDDLDALEGYRAEQQSRSHYIRVTRSVIAHCALPGGGTWEAFHTAWIYLAGPGVRAGTLPRITDDDWLAHVSAHR
jgi:gamma-glutamylcyclotransferase (GGCT)/AIG2-like uncharacterized protein YtfP